MQMGKLAVIVYGFSSFQSSSIHCSKQGSQSYDVIASTAAYLQWFLLLRLFLCSSLLARSCTGTTSVTSQDFTAPVRFFVTFLHSSF